MKKVLLTFILFFITVGSVYVQAQSGYQPTFIKGTSIEEVVLGVLNYAPEKMGVYKNALNSLSGVEFIKVCHSQKIWLLHVNRDVQANNTAIENAIKSITPSVEIYHKWANFADAEYLCQEEFLKQ